MVRILHTSDTHLGHQQYARADPRTGLNQREQDIYDTWNALIDAAVADPPDIFIHAGDLFDGVRPSNRALAVAMEGFLRLSQAGIETVIIAGNHDHPKTRNAGSPMRLFEHLPHIHPVYKGVPETMDLATTVHAVPQCSDADTLRNHMAALPRDGVLVIHGAVHNIEAFHHAEFNEQSLDPAWFEGFDYVALGHYHSTTEVADNAWYCGAPDRVSVKEAGESKGYLRFELGTTPQHQPLPVRPYFDVAPIDCAGLDAGAIEAACKRTLERAPEGAIARLRLHSIDTSLRGAIDQRTIRATGDVAHLELRLSWSDDDRAVHGAPELGTLIDEFESFAAQQPLDVDRVELMAVAKELMP